MPDPKPLTTDGVQAHSRPATREESSRPDRREQRRDSKASASTDKLTLSIARPRISKDMTSQEVKDQLSNIADESHPQTPHPKSGRSGSSRKQKVFDLTGLETREGTMLQPDTAAAAAAAAAAATVEQTIYDRLLNEEKQTKEPDFKQLPVSPIPTPWNQSRPQTSRSVRVLSAQERMVMVVEEGNVHLRYQQPKRCLSVYIHSACKGNEFYYHL